MMSWRDNVVILIFRQIDTTVIVSACFPLVENIVAWLFQRRGRKWTNQVIIERCRQVLHDRIANPPAVTPVDALQLCIEAAGKNKILSEDEILAHEFIFILAGYETTAAALLFTSYLLAKNPDVQKRLQVNRNSGKFIFPTCKLQRTR